MSESIPNIHHALNETCAYLAEKHTQTPTLGIVLGSGLGHFAETLEHLIKIPYSDIPHMPASKVVGHAGNLCFGESQGVPLVCMQGRVHGYEGHPLWQVVHGVRTMARLGVKAVLLTNAAGGLDPSWSPGDLMLLRDHLNLTGQNVLIGPNEALLGPRFPDMTEAYDQALSNALLTRSALKKVVLREGVYAGLSGPTYETPAEIRMLRALGAQAVGMSTVQEVIALRHMGVSVCAVSCITNLGAGILNQKLDHKEVEEIAKSKQADLLSVLESWISCAK